MNKETIKLDTFEGHLVLLCKGHYINKSKTDDFFKILSYFWSVRCGVATDAFKGDKFLENVADEMYRIMKRCNPERMEYFQEVLHRELTYKPFLNIHMKPIDMSHIQAVVWEYRAFLCNLKIKDTKKDKWYTLVSLPKPQNQILKRICNGNGRYKDYDLLTKKDKRK